MTARQPRILLLTPSFPPARGGIERTAGELAHRLTGGSVRVVAGRPRAGLAEEQDRGLRVHWSPNHPPGGRRATLAVLAHASAVAAAFRPQLVLALHVRTMPAARVARRLVGARVILVVHAKEMGEQPRLARAAMQWADAIVVVSGFSRELALEAGAAPERIELISPGVSLPSPRPASVADRPGPPTIVTVARLEEPYKGHDVVLTAFALLRARVPDARWIVLGEGALRTGLQARAGDLGLAEAIDFRGEVSDSELAHQLAAAHVFCLPSRRLPGTAVGEGFGIAFMEAAAYGLPVVGGLTPGVVEAVEQDVTGLLVDPEDPEAVAAALERLLLDPALAAEMGEAAARRAERFSWPLVVDRYQQLIDTTLSAPGRASRSREWGWAVDLLVGPR